MLTIVGVNVNFLHILRINFGYIVVRAISLRNILIIGYFNLKSESQKIGVFYGKMINCRKPKNLGTRLSVGIACLNPLHLPFSTPQP